MTNNFLSLLFAFKKNDHYYTFPLFEDVAATNIVYVRLQDLPNADGVLVPAFYIVAQNPKGNQYDTYYVSTNNFLSTLALLQTQLNNLGQQNSFTLYDDLQKINAFEVTPAGQQVLISDLWTKSRKYNVDENNTWIYTITQTNIQYDLFIVDGDATTAGNYYYNTYLTP